MRNIGLVIFACQGKGSNTQQLKVFTRNGLVNQISVDDGHCFKERFTLKLVILVNVHDPLHQYNVHFLVDVDLIGQGFVFITLFLKVLQNAVLVSTHILGVGVFDRHVVFRGRHRDFHGEGNPFGVELFHGRGSLLCMLPQNLLKRLATRGVYVFGALGKVGLGHHGSVFWLQSRAVSLRSFII